MAARLRRFALGLGALRPPARNAIQSCFQLLYHSFGDRSICRGVTNHSRFSIESAPPQPQARPAHPPPIFRPLFPCPAAIVVSAKRGGNRGGTTRLENQIRRFSRLRLRERDAPGPPMHHIASKRDFPRARAQRNIPRATQCSAMRHFSRSITARHPLLP